MLARIMISALGRKGITLAAFLIPLFLFFCGCAGHNGLSSFSEKPRLTVKKENGMHFNELTPDEERVIVHKGTERPFTGKFNLNKERGTYLCRRCDAPLFRSTDKFESGTGWPSFDDAIEGAVKQIPDADGRRTEIVCAKCGGPLGHVFFRAGMTD